MGFQVRTLLLEDCHLLPVFFTCWRITLVSVCCYEDTDPIVEALPTWLHLNLITFQRLRLQMPWRWGLGLHHMNLRGCKRSVHDIYLSLLLSSSTPTQILLWLSEVKSLSHVRLFATPWTVAYQAPWDSPGKNTRVGCPFLLQGIFPTQGSNPGLLYCRQRL